MSRTAIVLLNLGAPDSLNATQPFLNNLFKDPAILPLPFGIRHIIAWLISKLRTPKALKIYDHLGGSSPLLKNTQSQAQALQTVLGPKYKVFIAMRYWFPFTENTIEEVLKYSPDKIVLLPLYPQCSFTTTVSSFKEWNKIAKQKNLTVPTSFINCYPTYPPFINSIVHSICHQLKKVSNPKDLHLLFTAHSLPQRVIDQGDPYQIQVQQTVQAVMKSPLLSGCSHSLAYQSKVGPVKWIGPFVEEVLDELGKNHKSVMIVPVAFVSEHSETLYELDHLFKLYALQCGIKNYYRASTVNLNPEFIDGLAAFCYSFDDQDKSSSYSPPDSFHCDIKYA